MAIPTKEAGVCIYDNLLLVSPRYCSAGLVPSAEPHMPDAHGRPIHYAFIDSQNLNLGVQAMGWTLDFARFRIYLKERHGIQKAFLFIGFVPGNNALYSYLQDAGYICIFKPTLTQKNGTIKGNVDAELVLQAMIEFPEYDKALIVSGDGDFHCIVRYLLEKKKLFAILAPNRLRCSALLKFKIFRPYLRYMDDMENKLSIDKKRPHKDETL